MKRVHFIGIGGTGLSAIARVLLEKGYVVSGSDRQDSSLFQAITSAGARTFLGHAAEHVTGVDLVIRSSAIPDDNPEVIAARDLGIPVIKRAAFLEELTKDKEALAVAGSHGKTTTTAMLVWMLEQLGTQPSFISGGMINQLGCNAGAGEGDYFVIEADEYDYMFLGLSPKIAIVTNIEHDHPDCFPTETDYRAAFRNFLSRVRPDGLALMCLDDPQSRILIKEIGDSSPKLLTFGAAHTANYRAQDIRQDQGSTRFLFMYQEKNKAPETLGSVELIIPGYHNVLNATVALAAIHQLGLSVSQGIKALAQFQGAGRRFEVLGNINQTIIIDDYGHHPTQIAATLQAARSRYPAHRIWAVWQPHTFSRTQLLEKEYIRALSLADKVAVLKVYAAREKDPGYSAERIAKAIPGEKAIYIPSLEKATAFLLSELKPYDLAIVFSAGDATKISQGIMKGLAGRYTKESEQS